MNGDVTDTYTHALPDAVLITPQLYQRLPYHDGGAGLLRFVNSRLRPRRTTSTNRSRAAASTVGTLL